MKNLSRISFFTVILFTGISTSAQSNTCDLRLNTYEVMEGGVKGRTVGEATATAQNLQTGKVFKSKLVDRTAYFPNMSEGKYRIVVLRQGYERVRNELTVACTQADPQNIFCRDLALTRVQPTPPGSLGELVFEGVNVTNTAGGPVRVGCKYPLPRRAKPKSFDTGIVSGGVLNFKALSLPKPPYPPKAKADRASGVVVVQVLIDEEGNVAVASAIRGHSLLRAAAVAAARSARFPPTQLEGSPVKVSGVITYNFVP